MSKTTCKVIAVVKMNDGLALALDQKPKLVYRRNKGAILGSDGCFLSMLYHDHPWGRFKAFVGREFDIPLDTGEIIHCKGQWWHGQTSDHDDLLPRGENLTHIAAASVDDLTGCYVFSGYEAVESELKKLMADYKGPVYEYWDFDKVMRMRRRLVAKKKGEKVWWSY